MADPLSICASVVSLAGAGLKLSTTLYTYSATAFKADKELRDIAENVSVTSSVLDQLGRVLEEDKKARLCSDSALRTTEGVAERCKSVFQELDVALKKSLSKSRDGKLSAVQKMKWPFLEPKIKLAQSNLESIKSTLLLMLNVVSYARNVAQENQSEDVEQRQLIASLIETNKETNRRFEDMQDLMQGMHIDTLSRATTLQVDATSIFSSGSTLAEGGSLATSGMTDETSDPLCKLCQEDWQTKPGHPHYKLQDFRTSITEIRGLLGELIQAEDDMKSWNNKTAQKSCSEIRDTFHSAIKVLCPVFDKEKPHAISRYDGKGEILLPPHPYTARPAPLDHDSSELQVEDLTRAFENRKRRRASDLALEAVNEISTEHTQSETIPVQVLPSLTESISTGDGNGPSTPPLVRTKKHKRGMRGGSSKKRVAPHPIRDDSDSTVQDFLSLESQAHSPITLSGREYDADSDNGAQDLSRTILPTYSGAITSNILNTSHEVLKRVTLRDDQQDYQMQLTLLEQQNQKRLLMARHARESMNTIPLRSTHWENKAPATFPSPTDVTPSLVTHEQTKLPYADEHSLAADDGALENFDFDSFAVRDVEAEDETIMANEEFTSSQPTPKKRRVEGLKAPQQFEKLDGAVGRDADPVQELLSEWTTVFDKESVLHRGHSKGTPALPVWQDVVEHAQDIAAVHDFEDNSFHRGIFDF